MWIIYTLNGVSFAMLLFLLSSGLTLMFGLMDIINLAHGAFYLVAVYIGYEVMARTGSFLLSMLAGATSIMVIGVIMERFFLRPYHKQYLPQVLLTVGFALVLADVALIVWGGQQYFIEKPAIFMNPVYIGKTGFPSYRLFVIAVGIIVAASLWLFWEKTRVGSMVRAAVDDEEVARGMGIRVPRLFVLVFALGAFLAGLCGVLGGPILGAYPGLENDIVLLTLIVIIVGGVGSLKGALMGSLVIGLLDNFGRVLFPQLALFTVFAFMVIILAVRPSGLFGRSD